MVGAIVPACTFADGDRARVPEVFVAVTARDYQAILRVRRFSVMGIRELEVSSCGGFVNVDRS